MQYFDEFSKLCHWRCPNEEGSPIYLVVWSRLKVSVVVGLIGYYALEEGVKHESAQTKTGVSKLFFFFPWILSTNCEALRWPRSTCSGSESFLQRCSLFWCYELCIIMGQVLSSFDFS